MLSARDGIVGGIGVACTVVAIQFVSHYRRLSLPILNSITDWQTTSGSISLIRRRVNQLQNWGRILPDILPDEASPGAVAAPLVRGRRPAWPLESIQSCNLSIWRCLWFQLLSLSLNKGIFYWLSMGDWNQPQKTRCSKNTNPWYIQNKLIKFWCI